MGAFPTSDMPGHKRLHERVTLALDTCQELEDVDFKESQPWSELQLRIIKTSLAMANLRDVGIIVIGVSERGQTWALTGITAKELATFDVDKIIAKINAFASPHVDIDIVLVSHRDVQYLAIQVHEFSDTPIVCRKNGDRGLVEGGLYIRPPGKAQTTRAMNAPQMDDLLELAAEKRARRILEVAGRVGLVPRVPAGSLFDRELAGL